MIRTTFQQQYDHQPDEGLPKEREYPFPLRPNDEVENKETGQSWLVKRTVWVVDENTGEIYLHVFVS